MLKLSGLGGRLYRGETSVDFVGKRKIWYSFSGLLILASAITLFAQGLHLGIEFKGGSSFMVTTTNASIDTAKQSLTDAKIVTQNIIQKVGSDKVRIQTDALTSSEQNALEATLAKNFNVSVESIDSQIIGPSWGEEITRKALYGLFGFLLVVMLYLAMTFEAKMAISAIIAVIHDVVITVGIYALVGFEVTPATIIGFLTILGYSLYDTVVVFDKVRENTKGIAASGRTTYSKAANLAVNPDRRVWKQNPPCLVPSLTPNRYQISMETRRITNPVQAKHRTGKCSFYLLDFLPPPLQCPANFIQGE